tara:strand:- start:39085 stop:39690 length:606 start_codon:yes stop_codon:yes gene_type:complete
MGKYDDMFNKHFNESDFDGDPEKRDFALKSFNKMMKSLENVSLPDEFISKYLDNLDMDIFKAHRDNIFDGIDDDDAIILPIFTGTEEMIKNHGMSFSKVKLKRKKSDFLITEVWETKNEGYVLNQKYILDIDLFNVKSEEIKSKIVKKLIENNYINDNENLYLNSLSVKEQKKYYNILLNSSIDNELYEESALYRDKLNTL